MQTELMAAANASQQFTVEVWQAILTHNEEAGQQVMYQAIRINRINDALAFLQTADLQRNHEQAIFRQNLSEWADRQQTATHQLMLEQQRLRTEVDSTQAALLQVTEAGQPERRTIPSYLQAAPAATPPRRIRPPAVPTEEADPPQEQPTASRMPDDTRQAEENPDERLARIIAETIANTLTAQATRMTNSSASTGLPAPRVTRLKLENPAKFERKPKMPFRTWWDSVRDYIRFYPKTSGIERIAWIGTLLTDEAKEWHQARRRLVGDADTWNAYSEALQDEYLDPRKAATAFNQLSALRYKGDIKAYLTAFRALNIHARVTGEALQSKVNVALPLEIIDIRFAQNPRLFTEDEPFLVATYEAGRYRENRNLLAKVKAATERGSRTGSQNATSKGANKGSREQGKRNELQRNESQVAKTEKAKLWKGLREAFQGVPQDEIDEHKKNTQGCWRCGRDNHSTYHCYACTTKKGTTLAEAPGQVSATTSSKRKREETGHAIAAATEEEDRSEAPLAWAQDSESEEDF